MVRAPALHAGGHRFKSCTAQFSFAVSATAFTVYLVFTFANLRLPTWMVIPFAGVIWAFGSVIFWPSIVTADCAHIRLASPPVSTSLQARSSCLTEIGSAGNFNFWHFIGQLLLGEDLIELLGG